MPNTPNSPAPRLLGVAPILLVTDVMRSEAHYRERLGFEPGRLYSSPPDFCIQERDGLKVMLAQSPTVTPLWRVVHQLWSAYFWVDDAAALYDNLVARGATIDYGLDWKPYGVLEFGVQDPDGHDIGFGQLLS